MPIYDYHCDACESDMQIYYSFKEHINVTTCDCGQIAKQVVSVPMLIKSRMVYYDSPIDGRPITSEAARREDMAKNDCVEYDPGMRQDNDRHVAESQQALDRSIDDTMEKEISHLSSRQLETLNSEIASGASADVVRDDAAPPK